MADNTGNIGKLFARIAKVSGELGKLKKDAIHAQGYPYFSADSIMGHINSLMAENGLAVIPTVLDCAVIEGIDKIQRWLVTYEFTIGDIDGNIFSSRWTGEAPMQGKYKDGTLYADDKSMGKAHTYAYKYWLQKLFMISTVDADDLDKNVTDTEKPAPAQKQSNQGKAPNQSKPAQGKPNNSLDPDDHFGKKDEKAPILFQTKPILSVETRAGKKEGDKPYMVAAGLTIFNREPFRALGYDEDVINQLGLIGNHKFLEEEAFTIVWRKEGNNKIPVKMIVSATEQAYEFK